jgi:hypothetical protein
MVDLADYDCDGCPEHAHNNSGAAAVTAVGEFYGASPRCAEGLHLLFLVLLSCRQKLRGHKKTVEDLVFQPGSSSHLISVGDDAQVRLAADSHYKHQHQHLAGG